MQTDRKFFTLKRCLLAVALLVYLTGVFRYGIFEVAHALSHQFTDGHAPHSHHAHGQVTDHEHDILDISKNALEVQQDAPISQDDRPKISYDKILHVFTPVALQNPPVGLRNRKIPLFDSELPPSPFMQTTTPPPDGII